MFGVVFILHRHLPLLTMNSKTKRYVDKFYTVSSTEQHWQHGLQRVSLKQGKRDVYVTIKLYLASLSHVVFPQNLKTKSKLYVNAELVCLDQSQPLPSILSLWPLCSLASITGQRHNTHIVKFFLMVFPCETSNYSILFLSSTIDVKWWQTMI